MNKWVLCLIVLQVGMAGAAELKTQKAKQSYGIGFGFGNNIKNQGLTSEDLDTKAFKQGLQDSLQDEKPALSQDELRQVMQTLQRAVEQRQQQEAAREGAANIKEAEAYLAKNKVRKGVQVTASGLQYEVLRKGEGDKPVPSSQVTVHYKGTFVNEDVFDSSYERKQPATFALNQVIKGWTEGLQLMSAGSKYRFVIPPNLAYGEAAPPSIGPNRLLIFEVELLSFETPLKSK